MLVEYGGDIVKQLSIIIITIHFTTQCIIHHQNISIYCSGVSCSPSQLCVRQGRGKVMCSPGNGTITSYPLLLEFYSSLNRFVLSMLMLLLGSTMTPSTFIFILISHCSVTQYVIHKVISTKTVIVHIASATTSLPPPSPHFIILYILGRPLLPHTPRQPYIYFNYYARIPPSRRRCREITNIF